MSIAQASGSIIIVTGLSGSGKSTALNALEDQGYLAIDNLPVLLLPKLLSIRKESGEFLRLAVVMDAREPSLVSHHQEIFRHLVESGYQLNIVFIEAEDNTLLKRFSETRRPHPLAPNGDVLSAIQKERQQLAPLRNEADIIIDSSTLKSSKLREMIIERFVNDGTRRQMAVEILSFGFKNGFPAEADMMADVRFLPNPFYIEHLKPLDGRNEEVKNYVLSSTKSKTFLKKYIDLLKYLLPLYQAEGKSYFTVAIGCTGGQHRSVAIAGYIYEALKNSHSCNIMLRHRDIT